jgi:hypothetical protein
MSTKFKATIRHHSIRSARVIQITGTLASAKRAASREFGDEFRDHEIVIYTGGDDAETEIVACRKVGDRRWITQS